MHRIELTCPGGQLTVPQQHEVVRPARPSNSFASSSLVQGSRSSCCADIRAFLINFLEKLKKILCYCFPSKAPQETSSSSVVPQAPSTRLSPAERAEAVRRANAEWGAIPLESSSVGQPRAPMDAWIRQGSQILSTQLSQCFTQIQTSERGNEHPVSRRAVTIFLWKERIVNMHQGVLDGASMQAFQATATQLLEQTLRGQVDGSERSTLSIKTVLLEEYPGQNRHFHCWERGYSPAEGTSLGMYEHVEPTLEEAREWFAMHHFDPPHLESLQTFFQIRGN